MEESSILACKICNLQQTVEEPPSGSRIYCARCNYLLFENHDSGGSVKILCFSLAALILYFPAIYYPIISVSDLADTHYYNAMSGIYALWQEEVWFLAIPIILTSIIFPFFLILMLVGVSIRHMHNPAIAINGLNNKVIEFLSLWSVNDVFLLAIFVTVIKLADMTKATPTFNVIIFFAMILLLDKAITTLEEGHRPARQAVTPTLNSLNRPLAYIVSALILFIPANVYPIISLKLPSSQGTETIFSGVVELCRSGMWGLGLLVLAASILIPLFKIIGILFLILTIEMRAWYHARTKLYLFICKIGRLSMLDVYVVSLLVAVVQMGDLASAQAEIGITAFAFVVIITMIAAESFDPRLIWLTASESKSGKDTYG